MDTLFAILLSLGTGLAGSFSGWLFGRKRQHIDNINMAVDTWDKIVKSLESQINDLLVRVDTLAEENTELRKKISELEEEVRKKNRDGKRIELLQKKIDKYEKLLTENGIVF